MDFKTFCDILESIRGLKSHKEKFEKAREFLKTRDDPTASFQLLRLLVPKMDRDRASYRIKESKISKIIIKMLGLPPGQDRSFLEKAPSAGSYQFGNMVTSVLKRYITKRQTTITTQDMNTFLDKLANRESDNGLDDLILSVIKSLSARDCKWFIQLLLKDLRLGISDNELLNCYHLDGARYYSISNNLSKLCTVLFDQRTKLDELEINLFEAFRPMLSKRSDGSNFTKCFHENTDYFIENKFDGERFQIHWDRNTTKYYSRRGFDFTDSFIELTAKLSQIFAPTVTSVILDGEMMLWNTKTNSFGSKGLNYDVKKLGDNKKYKACFCAFDILLVSGQVLTNMPLEKRLSKLRSTILNPVEGTLVLSNYRTASSRNEIVDALNASIADNEEGIIIKEPKSLYKCGERNEGWFKMKMDYFDDAVHDLDVVLMGGIACNGNGKKFNSFIVGIASGPDIFLSMGRIGSGLNNEQLDLLSSKICEQGRNYKEFSTENNGKLCFGKEVPDYYIEPENSCILVIRASELIRTTGDAVRTPYTLRFPRILAIRYDKPLNECLTMNELLEMTRPNKAVVKLNKRHLELEEILSKARAKKIKTVEVVKLEHAKKIGNFLEGIKFNVFCVDSTWSKDDIYNSIKKAGGKINYHLEEGIDIVLVGNMDKNVQTLMAKNHHYDIVHLEWFRRVLDCGELLEYESNELIARGLKPYSGLDDSFDFYGDHFTDETDINQLKRVFQLMDYRNQWLNVNGCADFNSNPVENSKEF